MRRCHPSAATPTATSGIAGRRDLGQVGCLAQTRQQGSLAGQAIPPFEELLLARCAQRQDRGAAVVASALAALAQGHLRPHAQTTARACQAAATGLPRWVADIGRAQPTGLPIGEMPPIPRPPANPPVAITEAVSQTVGLTRLNQIAEFFGEGRKLTKTGQPTLADARVLVPLLGTADRLDEQIGERTFKTKSAKELRELAFTLRWAVAAGAIRKQHGRYHASATWQELADEPLQRWRRAAEALWKLGPLAAFHDTSWGSL